MHTRTEPQRTFAQIVLRWAMTRSTRIAMFGIMAVASQVAGAQVLVFDRGLPTTNLNNAVPVASRSNVFWADDKTLPVIPYSGGDDFTLSGTGPYLVNKIRVWSLDNTNLSLRGGPAGGPIGVISTSFVATAVTYANGQGYQTPPPSGTFLQMYQIDFTVSVPLNGGVPYQFVLDGTPVSLGSPGYFRGPWIHASNAALSGSPQAGADGTFLYAKADGTVTTWNSQTGAGTYCEGAAATCIGWDKVSDANVQVFAAAPTQPSATAVPATSSAGLAGLAVLLAGAGALVMRRRRSA